MFGDALFDTIRIGERPSFSNVRFPYFIARVTASIVRSLTTVTISTVVLVSLDVGNVLRFPSKPTLAVFDNLSRCRKTRADHLVLNIVLMLSRDVHNVEREDCRNPPRHTTRVRSLAAVPSLSALTIARNPRKSDIDMNCQLFSPADINQKTVFGVNPSIINEFADGQGDDEQSRDESDDGANVGADSNVVHGLLDSRWSVCVCFGAVESETRGESEGKRLTLPKASTPRRGPKRDPFLPMVAGCTTRQKEARKGGFHWSDPCCLL